MSNVKNQQGSELDEALKLNFIQKNFKKIGAACLAIIVVIFACIGYHAYSENRNQKAAEALYPCQNYFQNGVYDKALNGDGQNCVGLIQVISQYGSTKSGNAARLYAGLASAQLEKYEDAAKYLEDFDPQDDAMISPAAIGALGAVYAELGQNDKAVKALKKAAEKADNTSLSPIYLIQAGEILESEGKTDEALALYQQVKDKYSISRIGGEVDKYIERINASK